MSASISNSADSVSACQQIPYVDSYVLFDGFFKHCSGNLTKSTEHEMFRFVQSCSDYITIVKNMVGIIVAY